jgi:hypothetical protein
MDLQLRAGDCFQALGASGLSNRTLSFDEYEWARVRRWGGGEASHRGALDWAAEGFR